jgi:hypothetical protein
MPNTPTPPPPGGSGGPDDPSIPEGCRSWVKTYYGYGYSKGWWDGREEGFKNGKRNCFTLTVGLIAGALLALIVRYLASGRL